MAKKKTSKSAEYRAKKKAEESLKRNPFVVVVVIILIVAIVGCVLLHKKGIIHIPFLDSVIPQEEVSSEYVDSDYSSNSDSSQEESAPENVESQGGEFTAEDILAIKDSDLSIHFLELGNKYTGDCTLIKAGDTEVLIDAGSRKNSAPTIKAYLDEYCTDGVLEYVIATHAHEDHIAGLIGTKSGDSRTGILYQYEVETLIQFARTDYGLVTDKGNATLYSEYCDAAEYAKSQGTKVYSALDCWNNENGGQRTYYLDKENTISMNILYNYFYENKTSGGGGENEYSVCMLLSQADNHYLFTGDLEAKGEEYLVQNNDLPKCRLFKGGHHGSYTATTENLLAAIQPDIVCVCCCCGSTEYTKDMANTFPAQAFVDRIAPYTEQVYVTTIVSDNEVGFTSMNGNIVITSNGGELKVRCSNNVTLFKDTDWFKANRTTPSAWR